MAARACQQRWQTKQLQRQSRYHFPYPNKWSDTEQIYWKWTRKYASRFKFAYSVGYSKFAYEIYGGKTSVAGYFIGNPTIRNTDGTNISRKKSKNFPFESSMKGFIHLSENDDYGHRISFRANGGTLPSVCIKLYENKPKFDECQVKDTFTFLGYTTAHTVVFDGFMTDTRPSASKYSPRFRVFLDRRQSTLY